MAILGYAHNTGWNAALRNGYSQVRYLKMDLAQRALNSTEALKKAFADQIQLPESSAKPTSIPDPAAKGSKEESGFRGRDEERRRNPQAKRRKFT